MALQEFSDLLGHTLSDVQKVENDEIRFTLADGSQYRLYHEQDCCESVTIEDICGDLASLVGHPLLMAEEATNNDYTARGDRETWTFYKLSTVLRSVTIRWYGTSNGYYSESVDFGSVPNN
jgi:hypothetical protein